MLVDTNASMRFILLTIIFILLSHYLAMFPHEYAHSLMAWLLGFKANPFALSYGDVSGSNILLLSQIDENVDYAQIFAQGHPWAVALIAFAGPGLANGLMFIASFLLLKNKRVQNTVYCFYFLFWFNLMNLGNFYDYVPIRTFASSGDVHNFVMGLNISPWWVFVIGGYLVAFLIWQFFTKTLFLTFRTLNINNIVVRRGLIILIVSILFGFFGGFPYIYFLGINMDPVTYFLSATSFIAIPGMIILLWPKIYQKGN